MNIWKSAPGAFAVAALVFCSTGSTPKPGKALDARHGDGEGIAALAANPELAPEQREAIIAITEKYVLLTALGQKAGIVPRHELAKSICRVLDAPEPSTLPRLVMGRPRSPGVVEKGLAKLGD